MAENMVRKQSEEEGEVKVKVKVKATDQEMVISEKVEAPWQKPKNGSVFPAKRKSVKKMMCECMVQCVTETCCLNKNASNSKQGSSANIAGMATMQAVIKSALGN